MVWVLKERWANGMSTVASWSGRCWLGFLTMVPLYGKCWQWNPAPQWKLFRLPRDPWNWRGLSFSFGVSRFLTLHCPYQYRNQPWSYPESHAIYTIRQLEIWEAGLLWTQAQPSLAVVRARYLDLKQPMLPASFSNKNTLRNLRAGCQKFLLVLVFLEWLHASLTEYFKQDSGLAIRVGKDIFRI